MKTLLCSIVLACACGDGNMSGSSSAEPTPAGAAGSSSSLVATAGTSASTPPAGPPPAVGGSGGLESAAAGMNAMAGGAAAHAAAGGESPPPEASDAGSEEDAPPSAKKPRCSKKASQLIVLGDSYLNWVTHTFPDDFARELGGDYRFYAEPGASMASGGIATPVPDQLARALADDPDVIAAVMTGGGNDILLADTERYPGSDECKERADSPTLKVCQDVVAAALTAAKNLIATGADAGIEDVIYIYYPRIPGSLLGIFATSPNEILDYSQPMARAMCDQTETDTGGAMRCHFLDLQPIFEGHADWFADDGIHENATGSAVIAQEVVKMMKASCIAQPESSGCCAP